ncbi:LytR C-terminal domain-containing protein [Nocardia sp. NPDC005366]|uniref:LytR C-terminal domain-containing protein n=1 Tax=Nocardia sp. NPDC005366 TaxID=3156878 RepID=UPI0033A68295
MSYPNPTSGGPPLRALAMVLIALAIVFAGLGAMSLSSSEADDSTVAESQTGTTSVAPVSTPTDRITAAASSAPVTTTAAATTTPTTATPATTAPQAAPAANRAVPIRVLNNSLVAGLASRTAGQLQADGWTNVSSGNYAGGNIAKTTVYYGNSPGEREAAMEVARALGATAEPKSSDVGDSGAGVVVILAGN